MEPMFVLPFVFPAFKDAAPVKHQIFITKARKITNIAHKLPVMPWGP